MSFCLSVSTPAVTLGRLSTALLLSLLAAAAAAQPRPAPPARVAPGLLETAAPRPARVLAPNAGAFAQRLARELPQLRARRVGPNVLEVSAATPAQLAQLAAWPETQFVDRAQRPVHDERALNAADLNANSVTPLHRRYPQLAGQGLTVSVKENPIDPTDIDFRGRLLNTDATAVIQSAHASIMSTLIAGAGNTAPAGRGVAWQARIAWADYANLLPDPDADLTGFGVSVQNHSYGTAVENYYGLEAVGHDAQARRLPALLHVFSSGNSGNLASPAGNSYAGLAGWANLTGQFKMSKNTLSVGATDALGQVAPLSSRGPAYDGRVKPELVAFGDGGSSDAAALVSGIGLLVQQAYRDRNNGQLSPSALVKAVLLNSADDVGRPEVDFVSGYGQADALGAVRTVLDGRYLSGSLAATGQEQTFALAVSAGTQQLKITLAWTDPEAAANSPQALVNDLDLELTDPNGQTFRPWTLSAYPHPDSLARPARRGLDRLNPVEQITVAAPAAGTYQVRVRGFRVPVGPQAFSLAYETAAGFEWLTPTSARNVRPGQPALLRWSWLGPAVPARLEYKPVGAQAWRSVAANVDLAQRTQSWAAPDTTALAQVRCVVGANAYVSDTFALARPVTARVGYVCGPEALLYWPRVPGAAQYQVYALSGNFLEPLRLVADTALVFGPAAAALPYYAVAPVLGKRPAERGPSTNLASGDVGCYIRSFLPRLPAADTVRLALTLGSLYRLQAVRLQRLDPTDNTFRTIQTVQPVAQLAFLFTDLDAQPGPNVYRVEVQPQGRAAVYSPPETVQRTGPADAWVYPNPVRRDVPLRWAVGDPGPVRVRVFDALGRVRLEASGEGVINEIDLGGLTPGAYVLRLETASGRVLHRRVAVE